MKVQSYGSDGAAEREVLIGMVVSTKVLAKIAPRWPDKGQGLFASAWVNLVADWCVNYHRKYAKAPANQIEGLYRQWADSADPDTAKLVEKFLQDVSGEYQRLKKGLNPEFVADRAALHFDKVWLRKLMQDVGGDLDTGRVKHAVDRVLRPNRVTLAARDGVDVLNDRAGLIEAFQGRQEVLVEYGGAAGRFFGDQFYRGAFVAFQAAEKTGKSTWLVDVGVRAVRQRRRVLYFEAGDSTGAEFRLRLACRLADKPHRNHGKDNPIMVPTSLEVVGKDVRIAHVSKVCNRLTAEEAWKATQKFQAMQVKSREPYFRMADYPNSSLTVEEIRSVVAGYADRGWVPDVVLIDYADILAAPPGFRGETRDAVNDNWKNLRRLSQEGPWCVVTATQANAASYKTERIDMSNFSEDKRKNAHVTAMIAINRTKEDRANKVARLNYVNGRTVGDDGRDLYAAGTLETCNPCMVSAFKTFEEKEEGAEK